MTTNQPDPRRTHNPKSRRCAPARLGIVLFDGVEPLDYQGPCEIFDLWRTECDGPDVVTIGATGGPITCAFGRSHLPQYGFSDCPDIDALLTPGGPGRRAASRNHEFMEFINRIGQNCDHILSVCTGSFLLAEAGLLGTRRVTTHWEFVNDLKAFPGLSVAGDQRVVRDGNVWTAAGICSGIDLALDFIDSFQGTRRKDGTLRDGEAGIIQCISQYYPSIRRFKVGHFFSNIPEYIINELNGSQDQEINEMK